MAWMNQEKKKQIVEHVKPILTKYCMKASFKVKHNTKLVVTLTQGKIDFTKLFEDKGYCDINPYHYSNTFEKGSDAQKFFAELIPALNVLNYDKSDIYTDYFDVGYYLCVSIGKWDKPYIKV